MGTVGKTYRPIAVQVEAKEEEHRSSLSESSTGVVPVTADADMEKGDEPDLPASKAVSGLTPEETGTKEEEAAASSPVTTSGDADEVLASAVESLSLQENPLQADFGDDKMEKQDPPSLPDDAEKSPVTKSVADETMADVSTKEEKPKDVVKLTANKMTLPASHPKSGFTRSLDKPGEALKLLGAVSADEGQVQSTLPVARKPVVKDPPSTVPAALREFSHQEI